MPLLDESGRAYCLNCTWRLVPLIRPQAAIHARLCGFCHSRSTDGKPVEVPEEGKTCTRCRAGVIPIRGLPQFHRICKACWKADGYRNTDGTVPDRCSYDGCEGFLRSHGASRRNRLCFSCYQDLYKQTWQTFYADLDIEEHYDPHWLYVGNIPFQWRAPDIIAWIMTVMPPRVGEEQNFTVRLGGYENEFNAYKECIIKFAFVKFDLVRDTCALLMSTYDDRFPVICGERRKVVAHPAVKFGRPGRWRDLPNQTRDWRIITGDVSVPMGALDPRLSLSTQGLSAHS